jgi:sigma-B regulation protein RsbU (phosphoserine phosphatase)
VRLLPGDLLLLFTDGLTDSPSEEGFLDFEGLEDFIFSIADSSSAQDFADTLCTQVLNRSQGRMRDDLALLAVRFGQARVADRVSTELVAAVEA